MTLISHRYKFIYIKTMKTASTSVQDFFRPYCMSPKSQNEYKSVKELSNQVVNEYGIMSMAGSWAELKNKGAKWSSHLGAEYIKDYLNDMGLTNKFDNYKKFSIVRNPWDMVISRYFHSTPGAKSYSVDRVKNELSKFIKNNETAPYKTGVIDGVFEINKPPNHWMLTVNGELACDYYIRYEHLKEDIEYICKELSIEDFDINRLGNFRNDTRPQQNKNYRQYYTEETKELINEIYSEYIKIFDYKF